MDLSYVLPIHASSYICNALLAWLILGENVSFLRWFATGFISVGVFIVGYSQYREKKKLKQLSSHVTVTPKDKVSPVFAFISSGVFLPTVWLGVIVMVLADSMGDLLNAKGMRQIATLKKICCGGYFSLGSRNFYQPLYYYRGFLSGDRTFTVSFSTKLG